MKTDTGSTSRSLLSRARGNDAEAWDRLVELYAPLVMYWCRRWDLRDDEAADVVQEVFRAVARNLERFRKDRQGDSFRGWLRTITRNKVMDHLRRCRREPRGVGGTEQRQRLDRVAACPATVDESEIEDDDPDATAQLMHRALEQIRGQFHDRTWRAFWRSAVDGLNATDVGDELSMSPGAVRVAKSRVLQRLREELGELL